MTGLDDLMVLICNQLLLFPGIVSPKHKHHAVLFLRNLPDNSVGELFPSLVFV
jgi:hypothetical protein